MNDFVQQTQPCDSSTLPCTSKYFWQTADRKSFWLFPFLEQFQLSNPGFAHEHEI